MAVPREEFRSSQFRNVSGDSMPRVERLIRQAAGDWYFHVWVDGEVELPDGRRVHVRECVPVRAGRQIGRRKQVVA